MASAVNSKLNEGDHVRVIGGVFFDPDTETRGRVISVQEVFALTNLELDGACKPKQVKIVNLEVLTSGRSKCPKTA